MKQHRDNVRLRASATGGLHATSMSATYPWSVQPRVQVGVPANEVKRLAGERHIKTVWVAFNALTGYTSSRAPTYEHAEQYMFNARLVEARKRCAFRGWCEHQPMFAK